MALVSTPNARYYQSSSGYYHGRYRYGAGAIDMASLAIVIVAFVCYLLGAANATNINIY